MKAKKENLELQTAIAVAEAKLQVFPMYEPARSVSVASGGLNENNFVDLPQVFAQREIPVIRENILQQKDVKKWKYLEEVCLPQIDTGIGLLIGTNVPEVLDPSRVINSGAGPFAVKTILGWIINGPLKRE